MAEHDLAPVTVVYPSGRAKRWRRAIINDGRLYIADQPRNPNVLSYELVGEPVKTGRVYNVTTVEGDWRISTCGCSKGSWRNHSADSLIASSTEYTAPEPVDA